jgi:exodeoxyribonuclease VII small subunit
MIPKKLAPAKAGVADFSDKIMRKIKGNRGRCGSILSKKRSRGGDAVAEKNPDVDQLTFERAIEELETIVKRLEEGKVPLEESVAIYERGETLKRRCEQLLRQAEARVEKIALDASGKPAGTEPLDGKNDAPKPPAAAALMAPTAPAGDDEDEIPF